MEEVVESIDGDEVDVTMEPAERTVSVVTTVVIRAPFAPVDVTVAWTEVVSGAVSVLLIVDVALGVLEVPALELELEPPAVDSEVPADVLEEDDEEVAFALVVMLSALDVFVGLEVVAEAVVPLLAGEVVREDVVAPVEVGSGVSGVEPTAKEFR